jgi:hypothetical protein
MGRNVTLHTGQAPYRNVSCMSKLLIFPNRTNGGESVSYMPEINPLPYRTAPIYRPGGQSGMFPGLSWEGAL